MPPIHKPTSIANFAITYRCTSRCKTCNIWKIEDPELGELTQEEIEGVFRVNRDFLGDVRSIQITGGEPYTRNDLPDIVLSIHGSLPRTHFWIATNGYAPKRIEKWTPKMLDGLDGQRLGVSVSIDGIDETHDAIRGIKGSYKNATETLQRLSTLCKDHENLSLSVGMTIIQENLGEMTEVSEMAWNHGADFSFRPVNVSDVYYRNKEEAPPMPNAIDQLLSNVHVICKALVARHGLRKSLTTLQYTQGAVDYIRDGGRRRLRCTAGLSSFFLDPYGDVYPCLFIENPLGNVRSQILKEILSSRISKVIRSRIGRGDYPGCWVECEVYREIARDRVGLLRTAARALLDPSTAGIR